MTCSLPRCHKHDDWHIVSMVAEDFMPGVGTKVARKRMQKRFVLYFIQS